MYDYNIKKFFKVTKLLAKEKGIRIGDIEKSLGVAHGYLGRVVNNNVGAFRLEWAIKIADMFGMYIDDIFFFDFDAHRLAYLKLEKEKREAELQALMDEMEGLKGDEE